MFVRTKKGKIFDCYSSEQMHKPIYYPKNSKTGRYIDYNEVYKKSENIIDILELGDYVNGREVVDIFYNENDEVIGIDTRGSVDYVNSGIKSIVTKEQFSQISYNLPKDK